MRVATKRFIGLGCAVECKAAPRPVRFEGQHRGCCDGCAWAARAVATLYGLRAPIAPIAHWPLPLASVMETSFLNVPRGRRARAGQFLSGDRSGRRRAACWRPLRHNSNLKWAASAGHFQVKRPNLGLGRPEASEFRPQAVLQGVWKAGGGGADFRVRAPPAAKKQAEAQTSD